MAPPKNIRKEERPEFDISSTAPEPDPELLKAGEKLNKKIKKILDKNRRDLRKKSRKYKTRNTQESGE